jgi:SsrA-binding protein
MIMANKEKKNSDDAVRIINRKAKHDYHIVQTLEVGIILQGSEVKSVRAGQVNLGDGYALVDYKTGKLLLFEVEIATYNQARGVNSHATKRVRELLAHKREITKLNEEVAAHSGTLVPLAMYFVRGNVKLELGVGTGKKAFDKREDIKEREAKREINRAMSKRREG